MGIIIIMGVHRMRSLKLCQGRLWDQRLRGLYEAECSERSVGCPTVPAAAMPLPCYGRDAGRDLSRCMEVAVGVSREQRGLLNTPSRGWHRTAWLTCMAMCVGGGWPSLTHTYEG